MNNVQCSIINERIAKKPVSVKCCPLSAGCAASCGKLQINPKSLTKSRKQNVSLLRSGLIFSRVVGQNTIPHFFLKFAPNSFLKKSRLTGSKNHWQLYTDEKGPFWVPTYIVYKFGKKVIITNKIPEDGKYIKKRSLDEPK